MKDSRSDVQDKLNAKILAYGHSSAPYNGGLIGSLPGRSAKTSGVHYHYLLLSVVLLIQFAPLRRRQWKIYLPLPLH